MYPDKIITIDASCSGFIMSLTDRKKEIYEEFTSSSKDYRGENLLYKLDEMVRKTGYDKLSTNLLITSKGPGSLTGLRISMSYIKTLAQLLNVKISAVPTLYVLERSSECKTENTPVFLQARKNMYYLRKIGQKPEEFSLVTKEEAVEIVDEAGFSLIESSCDMQSYISEDKFVLINMKPEVLYETGIEMYEKGEVYDYDELLPEYGGKSVAELLFEKKHKNL